MYAVCAPQDAPSYRTHLKLMHGVWTTDVKTLHELDECHRECHDQAIGHEIAHAHTLAEPSEEWVW